MIWEDECYLLSKRKFRENANIINIFTQKKGKLDGIVYGGTSRKVRNYLQISNKLFVSHTSKNENKIGYFKTELIEAIAPKYFDDKKRTLCLNSICSMLKMLLPENQSYKHIYSSLNQFFSYLSKENWLTYYLNWEINLITSLGYDTNLAEHLNEVSVKNDYLKTKIDGYIYEIPNYLIQKKIPEKFTNLLIRKSLYFTRQVMLNKFFIPNNLSFPMSRVILENYYN